MIRRTLFVVTTLVTLGGIANAAESSTADPTPRSPPRPRFYGEQIIAVDGVALGAIISGLALHPALALGGGALYAFGPPIVHLAHDNPTRAAGSFGLRIGAPLVGGALGLGTGLLLTD